MSNRTLTDQIVFDITAEHLLAQGKRAWDGDCCKYRTADGLRCAVGVHISDDEYNREMEGATVTQNHGMGLLPSRLYPHLDLLIELQLAHDNLVGEFDLKIKGKLGRIARSRGLSTAVLDTACGS